MNAFNDFHIQEVYDFFWKTAGKFDCLTQEVLSASQGSENERLDSMRTLYPFASDSIFHAFRLAFPNSPGLMFWLRDYLPVFGRRRRDSRSAVYFALKVNQAGEHDWGLSGLDEQVRRALQEPVGCSIDKFRRAVGGFDNCYVDNCAHACLRIIERPLATALSWFAENPDISHDKNLAAGLQNNPYLLTLFYEHKGKTV